MTRTEALEAAVQDLLVEHKDTELPCDVYEDLAIDIATFRGDRANKASLERLVRSTSGVLDRLRGLDQDRGRTFETAVRALDAVRNELRGPAVAAMADALAAAIRASDGGALVDDMVVNGVRTFSIDAMIDAETVARLLLEAADKRLG